MKHGLLILLVTFLFSAFLACKKTSTSESEKIREQSSIPEIQSSASRRLPDCPPGTHGVLTYDFDDFRFHRPKFNCERGFWFCTVNGGGWYINCVPNDPFARIDGTSAFVWAKELDNQVEIHFPLDLKKNPSYTADDLRVFSVDEEYTLFENFTLKRGNYPVRETGSELIVIVDLL